MGPSDAEDPGSGLPVFPYGSAAAFRTALRDRFAAIAKADTRYSLDELQRQFAYDRALASLFTARDADSWVLKGAGALLARRPAGHLPLGSRQRRLRVRTGRRSSLLQRVIRGLARRRPCCRPCRNMSFGFNV